MGTGETFVSPVFLQRINMSSIISNYMQGRTSGSSNQKSGYSLSGTTSMARLADTSSLSKSVQTSTSGVSGFRPSGSCIGCRGTTASSSFRSR